MEVVVRKYVQEMILADSNRIAYPNLEANVQEKIKANVCNHVLAITMDGKVIQGLVVCKYCHNLYSNAKWTMPRIKKHLSTFHPTFFVEHQPKEPSAPPPKVEQPIPLPITIAKVEASPQMKRAPPQPRKRAAPKEKKVRITDIETLNRGIKHSTQAKKRAAVNEDKVALVEYDRLHDQIDKLEHSTLTDQEKMERALPILDQLDLMRVPPVDGGLSRMDKAMKAAKIPKINKKTLSAFLNI